MNNSLTTLFQVASGTIVLLSNIQGQNNQGIPVAFLTPNKMDVRDIIVAETNNMSEKYILYYKGVGILFSSYQFQN